MIERYSLSPMKDIWTETAKYQKWLEVELACVSVMGESGDIPAQAAETIVQKAKIDVERAKEIEKEIKHDVLAFVRAVEESVGEEGRFLHRGLTSSDVLDTALAMQMQEGFRILIKDLQSFLAALKKKAKQHKYTVMVGRTHGMHAEPITFGLKILNWAYEMERNLERLRTAKKVISYGKISGSVGTYAHVDPQMEKKVLEKLGLKPAKISSQIIQRDRHAQVLSALAILGAGLERIAVELRHLQRTEVAEVKEKKSHGSSSMPHKENPITSETTTGQARLLRSNLQAALENIALWHERDISHSSVERIIIPDSFILADYMLHKMTTLISELIVYPEKMHQNLETTRGIVFSQGLLLKLVDSGISRKKAHQLIRENALQAWEKEESLKDLIFKDKRITSNLSKEEIEAVFDIDYWTKHVDEIYSRFDIHD